MDSSNINKTNQQKKLSMRVCYDFIHLDYVDWNKVFILSTWNMLNMNYGPAGWSVCLYLDLFAIIKAHEER